MWYEKIFSILSEYFNEKSCFYHVEKIHRSDRWFDFANFKKTALYCAEQMKIAGLKEVEMLPLKADGKTAYGDWVIPRAWDVSGAVLRTADSQNSVIADYNRVPCCLMMCSAPTPKGGITAEVIEADAPEKLRGMDVKDKLVFTSRSPRTVLQPAINGGASGIISDFMPMLPGAREKRSDVYDATRWENSFIIPVNNTGLFGFSLSPREGDNLRNEIHKAAVKNKRLKLHAQVDTRFYDGTVYTVSGMIPGTGSKNEDVLLCGHLYEPGANDNASGCGAVLELAAAIVKAIKDKRIKKPLNNIRIIMGYESMGIMGYCIKYPERIQKAVGALNMDMVGAGSADKAMMHIWHNPLSNWSYTDTLISKLNRVYQSYKKDAFEFVEGSFDLGDGLLSDPMLNVPTVSMLMHPAKSYHSSIDIPERLEPSILKRNGLICGAFLYFMAYPEKDKIIWLLERIEEHADQLADEKPCQNKAYEKLVRNAFFKGCLKLKKLAGGTDILFAVEETAKRLKPKAYPDFIFDVGRKLEARARSIVPRRIVRGCLTFHTLDEKTRNSTKYRPFYSYDMNCPLFWTDGKRNLLEIAGLTAVELGKENACQLLEDLVEYYVFLQRHGYIEFLNPLN